MYLRIALMVAAAAAVALLWTRGRTTLRRWHRRRRRDRECPGLVAAQGTILVVLRHRREAAAAAATLRDLWDKAACPDRVHVVVYQEVRAGDPDVYALAGGGPVRVLTAEAGAAAAPLGVVLAEAMARGRAHERTVALVPTKAVFAEGWDRDLLDDLAAAAGRFGPGALLTAVPDRPRRVPRSNGMNGPLYRAIMRERGSALQSKETVPTVPVWTDALHLASRPRGGERTGRPVPAVGACPAFACGAADLFAKLRPQRPGEGDDLWLSRALFAAGARLRVAERVPVTALGGGGGAGSTGTPTPRDAAFDAYAGLRVDGAVQVSGRALLGVTADDDAHDVAAKFGSRSEFERIKAAFA